MFISSIKNETNDVFTEFIAINNNYEQIPESKTNRSTSKTVFSSQICNKSKLPTLLAQYVKVFSKSKYDFGKIRMELQKIHLTSELPISFQAYRTISKEEIGIKKQIQNLLQADLIKENFSPYSEPLL